MNAWIGWLLTIGALLAGWQIYGWPGIALAFTVIMFWLLLQFTRIARVMRAAGKAPVGHVDSAVMLNAKLTAGKPLLDVLRLTKSLGRKVAEEPETFVWADPGGASVRVLLDNGRVTSWQLERPPPAAAARRS
jgi:Flp pilus assembly protein TadB